MLLRTGSSEGQQNLGLTEMSQRCPFLVNIAHKSLTTKYAGNIQETVGEMLSYFYLVSPQLRSIQRACGLTKEPLLSEPET
jgi:hypothetical protein